jgi:hypothetical protein
MAKPLQEMIMGRPGYIYVMRLHVSDNIFECPYKIGQSVNPTIRRSQIGIVMPYEISVVKMIRTNDMDWCEALFHESFERDRMQGEWYRLDEDGLVYLLRTNEFNNEDLDLPF